MVSVGKEHASLCAKVVSWFKLVCTFAFVIPVSLSESVLLPIAERCIKTLAV